MNHFSKAILLLVTGLSVACGQTETETETSLPQKGAAIPVEVISLQQSFFSSEITASGTFTTKDETLLSFKIGGVISKILVNEGDKIKAGQLLATLDLTEIQAGLAQAKLSFEKALRDQQRVERLFKDSVATLEQLENAKTGLDIAAQQVKAAEFNLNYSQIRASKSGFVLRKFANPGQLIASGSPVLQVNGAKNDNWVLQVSVTDQQWNLLAVGDPAILYPATSEIGVNGSIIRKSQAADPQTGTYWIEVKPSEDKNLNLASGMFGKVVLTPKVQKEGWQIPYQALLDAQGDTGYVFVSSEGKTAKKIQVKLGSISDQSVQVLSGLEGYNQLVVTGSAYLTDGSTIEIKNK